MIYFEKGVYSLTTAAKILNMNPQKMRRWINGYTYYKNKECRSIKPLFKAEYNYNSEDVIISFLDLTELLFIKTFMGHGISIQKIRKAAIEAAKLLDASHPFAIRKMFTDGKTIFAKIAKEANDSSLLDLLQKQYQLGDFIESILYECIDFGKDNYTKRWWPLGKDKDIVLDPLRSMGQPIINTYNVKTELIYDLYKANHNINEICDWYELDKNSVKLAIEYEKSLAA